MDYQRIRLRDQAPVGAPAPLPRELQGLADASLANLGWTDADLGYRGDGFFPYVPPPPAPASVRVISVRAFMRRFSGPELVAIEEASATNAQLRVLTRLLYAGPTVDLDHADTATALAYLTAQALIASGRSAAITA